MPTGRARALFRTTAPQRWGRHDEHGVRRGDNRPRLGPSDAVRPCTGPMGPAAIRRAGDERERQAPGPAGPTATPHEARLHWMSRNVKPRSCENWFVWRRWLPAGSVDGLVVDAVRTEALQRDRSAPLGKCAVGEVLAQEPVGVLIGGAPPRAVRIGEVDPRARPKAHVTHAESRRELFAAVTGGWSCAAAGAGP